MIRYAADNGIDAWTLMLTPATLAAAPNLGEAAAAEDGEIYTE